MFIILITIWLYFQLQFILYILYNSWSEYKHNFFDKFTEIVKYCHIFCFKETFEFECIRVGSIIRSYISCPLYVEGWARHNVMKFVTYVVLVTKGAVVSIVYVQVSLVRDRKPVRTGSILNQRVNYVKLCYIIMKMTLRCIDLTPGLVYSSTHYSVYGKTGRGYSARELFHIRLF